MVPEIAAFTEDVGNRLSVRPIVILRDAVCVAVDCTAWLVDDEREALWPFDDDGIGAWDRDCTWLIDGVFEAVAETLLGAGDAGIV